MKNVSLSVLAVCLFIVTSCRSDDPIDWASFKSAHLLHITDVENKGNTRVKFDEVIDRLPPTERAKWRLASPYISKFDYDIGDGGSDFLPFVIYENPNGKTIIFQRIGATTRE